MRAQQLPLEFFLFHKKTLEDLFNKRSPAEHWSDNYIGKIAI